MQHCRFDKRCTVRGVVVSFLAKFDRGADVEMSGMRITLHGVSGAARLLLLSALLLPVARAAYAEVRIVYRTESLGGNQWRYSYIVSGHAFAQDEGFRIYFPESLYQVPEQTPGFTPDDWDALIIPPDAFNSDATLVAQAIHPVSVAAQFSVNFAWLNEEQGIPGSQRYELFGADFATLDPPGSLITAAVPEPQRPVLLVVGLALLALARWRRRR
jgi:hypothetical protein